MHSPTIIVIDDDKIDTFIIKKQIKTYNPNLAVISFEQIQPALEFFLHPGISLVNGIIFLDYYVAPHYAWDFLDTFASLPQDIQASFDIYLISSAIYDKETEEKIRQTKEVMAYFKKPLENTEIENLLNLYSSQANY